jgi:hypothetical protein
MAAHRIRRTHAYEHETVPRGCGWQDGAGNLATHIVPSAMIIVCQRRGRAKDKGTLQIKHTEKIAQIKAGLRKLIRTIQRARAHSGRPPE